MHYAILGDVQGNGEALRAVLEDIRARKIERVVCLGNVVGFGPDPVECLDLVRNNCFITIRGDHEQALLSGTDGLIPTTARLIEWAKEEIEKTGDGGQRMAFIDNTLDSFSSAGISFFHGSPRSSREYLFPSDVTRGRRKLRAAFEHVEKVCFHAHTHVPGVIKEIPLIWRSAAELEGYYHYRKGEKSLVNVGSVGQPRDGDPRAGYIEIRKNEIFWRRVAYDVEKVIERMEQLEVFGTNYSARLRQGR